MINLEEGIFYLSNIFMHTRGGEHLIQSEWTEPYEMNQEYFSPSESFTSYAFWLGRDSDEILSLVD